MRVYVKSANAFTFSFIDCQWWRKGEKIFPLPFVLTEEIQYLSEPPASYITPPNEEHSSVS